jgi:hypothetical protein
MAIAIALSPLLLHLIDRFMEWWSPISRKTLATLMRENIRIKEAVETDPKFEAIEHYFDFERDAHFIFAVAIFNLFSLYFAQMACTQDLLQAKAITLSLMVLNVAFIVAFFMMLYNRKIDVHSAGAQRWWKRPILIKWWKMVAVIAFSVVILTDIDLHFNIIFHFSCVRESAGH